MLDLERDLPVNDIMRWRAVATKKAQRATQAKGGQAAETNSNPKRGYLARGFGTVAGYLGYVPQTEVSIKFHSILIPVTGEVRVKRFRSHSVECLFVCAGRSTAGATV